MNFSLEKQHINVPTVFRNLAPAKLYEEALRNELGSAITAPGALAVTSGAKTGRSPGDKRIVEHPDSAQNIWWGNVNIALSERVFQINLWRAIDYLNTRRALYVVDGYAGWDPKYQLKVRIICSRAYHALFMYNMLIRPTAEQLESFGEPDFVVLNAGRFPANRFTEEMTSATSIALSFEQKQMVILGTEYAGEMKKGVFTVMNYLMPKAGVLSMHCSANEGDGGDVSLFFGLSGTGKTTLSADPRRKLIGDDEHCWTDDGVFNIEGGCYAKCIGLREESEPEIFQAVRFGALLENVVYDQEDREIDYDDDSITQNTRVSYPIEYIPNAKLPCTGGHPKNIILLTCDAFGVLPPVCKLTPEQAMYHFISGYTAKVAGTEQGVTEPEATFSACFGAAFMVWHPSKYAELLAEKMRQNRSSAWLVNTGWTGGAHGTGSRIKLRYTRAIIDAIHDGSLDEV
ncbi:MAG: phosphoenolpyruvate carboxykinase (ATP), partial [Bdellovibrionales bacterium]|nr:phosphoenolpyruvate carboxykinase (ATP) [Bdellovibrionales bacterium]